MNIGVVMPPLAWAQVPEWMEQWAAQGVHSVWLGTGSGDPLVQAAALAQVNQSLRIGIVAAALADTPPVLAAKQLLTLDQLSNGRLDVAIDDEQQWAGVQDAFSRLELGFSPGWQPNYWFTAAEPVGLSVGPDASAVKLLRNHSSLGNPPGNGVRFLP